MLTFMTKAITKTPMETLAVAVCEDADIYSDEGIRALIDRAKTLEEFSGEKKQQVILYDVTDTKIHRCIFKGIGPKKEISAEGLRIFAGQAAKAAQSAKSRQLVVAVPDAGDLNLESEIVITALSEGAFLANHTFETYKQKPNGTTLKEIALQVSPAASKQHAALLKKIETVCQSTLQARDWVSTPSNDKPPEALAKRVSDAAGKTGLKISVLSKTQLQRQKFGALLAVAAGSANPPCLVEMAYAPPKGAKKTIVLVGKGVTFDTGGINLKPSAGMDEMKADMSGAATVAATLAAVARLKPRHRVVGIMPMVENMPSGTATRPGDVVTSYTGKTVEIGNTDAEGRLILIDAMAYAIKKYKPDVLIDLATLTGACVVALGEKIAGVFSKDDALAAAVLASGETTFERCWRLPMPQDYKELLKSEIADINNMSSTRYGGAITAALFLSEFVGDTCWAHIDIAGPAFSKKAGDYCGPGGTGFGVRLLCDLIEKL
jgi:leucyl aminopeptidase